MARAAGIVLAFAVPKGGGLLGWLFGQNKQIEQLEPAGEFVQALNDEWALRVANGGHSSEEARRRALLPVRVVTGTKDLVVKEVSAKGTYGSIDWHPVEYGHTELVKPASRNDVRYAKAKDFLIACRPTLDRFAMLRLREISDRLLQSHSERFCWDWEYQVHVHGGAQYSPDDPLLAAGFSPYVVTRCRYRTIVSAMSVRIGFAWGSIATGEVWRQHPMYVHQVLTQGLSPAERESLSKAIEDVLHRDDKERWSAVFPRFELAIHVAGRKHPLVAGDIESGENCLLREYRISTSLSDVVGQEATFDLSFNSYAPKGTRTFTLQFPWLHVRFRGLLVVHETCRFSTSQFLSGEGELTLEPEIFGHKSELSLHTDDIVLPGTRVEIAWNPVDGVSRGGAQ
jgi:hypothetical protein